MSGDDDGFASICTALENEWTKPLLQQVGVVLWRQQVHSEFRTLLADRDVGPGDYFWENFHFMYLDSQLIAIRRLVDVDGRTLSIRRLLGQVQQHRRRLTRDAFVGRHVESLMAGQVRGAPESEHWTELHKESANKSFDAFTTKKKRDFVSCVDEDISLLDDATKDVVSHVNSFVAHGEKTPPLVEVTYESLKHSLAVMDKVICKYSLLVSGSAPDTALPTAQGDLFAFLR